MDIGGEALMVLLSSRLMFVYDQVPILQVKSQTARMCNKVTIQANVTCAIRPFI